MLPLALDMNLIYVAVSLIVMIYCIALHFFTHFKCRPCKEIQLLRFNWFMAKEQGALNFFPFAFLLYMLFVFVVSVVIGYQYVQQTNVFPIHYLRPAPYLLSISRESFYQFTSFPLHSYVDFIVYISLYIVVIWDSLIQFYRYETTIASARSFRVVTLRRILKRFSVYFVMFSVLYAVQTQVYYWSFPLVLLCYVVPNLYWSLHVAHVLMCSYHRLAALDEKLGINEPENLQFLRSVKTIRNLSIASCSVTCIYLTSFMLIYDMSCMVILPMLWTLSVVFYALNFIRNRMSCTSCIRCVHAAKYCQLHILHNKMNGVPVPTKLAPGSSQASDKTETPCDEMKTPDSIPDQEPTVHETVVIRVEPPAAEPEQKSNDHEPAVIAVNEDEDEDEEGIVILYDDDIDIPQAAELSSTGTNADTLAPPQGLLLDMTMLTLPSVEEDVEYVATGNEAATTENKRESATRSWRSASDTGGQKKPTMAVKKEHTPLSMNQIHKATELSMVFTPTMSGIEESSDMPISEKPQLALGMQLHHMTAPSPPISPYFPPHAMPHAASLDMGSLSASALWALALTQNAKERETARNQQVSMDLSFVELTEDGQAGFDEDPCVPSPKERHRNTVDALDLPTVRPVSYHYRSDRANGSRAASFNDLQSFSMDRKSGTISSKTPVCLEQRSSSSSRRYHRPLPRLNGHSSKESAMSVLNLFAAQGFASKISVH